MTERIVMHIDVNSAYLSWTAVKLLKEGYKKDIREIPSVIAGNPKTRQGIILAKSMPAKEFNINTGESIYEAKKKCPFLETYPPNYNYYLECSQGLYNILCEYSSLIQRYSIDECFLDYTSSLKYLGEPIKIAHEIKDRVKSELGFTVNIGVGHNKLCAKMAGEIKKPNLVHSILNREDLEKKLWVLPVSELFMVGRATQKKLKNINVNTIGDLANTDPKVLTSLLKSHGQLIWNYANGIDNTPVVLNENIEQKGIGNSMTIDHDVTSMEQAKKYLLSLTERVSGRLRSHGYRGTVITIRIKDNNFFKRNHQIKIATPTNDTNIIYENGCTLLEEAWEGQPLRQIGISVSEFDEKQMEQISLFEKETEKRDSINDTIDGIRAKYGEKSIFRGTFVNTSLNPLEGGVNDGKYIMMGGGKGSTEPDK